MAVAVQQIHPVAHLPLVLGVLRRLEVAPVIDRLIPPHPAHVLSCVGVRWEPGCWVVAVDRAGNQGMDDSDGKFTIQFPMKEAIKDKEVKEHWEGKDGWEKDIWEKDVGNFRPLPCNACLG